MKVGKPLIAYVKSVVDASKALLDLIKPETDKIDSAAIDGLTGATNSLGYITQELEKHFHNREKWFGAALVPSGETHVADRMSIANAPFSLTTGNNTFGNWVQIIGSSDTPVSAGMIQYDGHRFLIKDTTSTSEFLIEIVSGESADIAAKIAAEQFTEAPFISSSNLNDSGITDIMSSRTQTGEKVWARARCIGQDAKIIRFYFGLHEYLG